MTTPSPAAVNTEVVFPRAEYDRRLRAVHAEMAADGLDGVLVLGPENMFYLPVTRPSATPPSRPRWSRPAGSRGCWSGSWNAMPRSR